MNCNLTTKFIKSMNSTKVARRTILKLIGPCEILSYGQKSWKLPRDSFWQPRSWRCSCSCISPFPFWNGRPSASVGQIGLQWPPDYLKIIFLRCKHRRYLKQISLVNFHFKNEKSYYCNKLALKSRLRSRNTVYIPCVCQQPRRWCLD